MNTVPTITVPRDTVRSRIENQEPPDGQGWAAWVRTVKWDYWATGTFATPSATSHAAAIARRWVGELHTLREALYVSLPHAERGAYAVFAVERGGVLDRVHVHFLLGGIGTHPALLSMLARSWRWGQMDVSRYDPTLDPRGDSRRGASAYITKYVDEVQIVGRLQKFRPRARRLRGV